MAKKKNVKQVSKGKQMMHDEKSAAHKKMKKKSKKMTTSKVKWPY